MGARVDHIETLLPDPAAIKAYKAGQHLAEYQGLLPYAVSLGGGSKATILTAEVAGGNLVLTMEFRQGNTVLPFSNPWVIVNPPLLWPDPVGDVTAGDETYSENPLAVGRDMIERMFAKVSQ